MEETLAPPISLPPYIHPKVVEDPKPTERWHPKITIYRVLVLSTTIGLGSAKAVAVHRGDKFVSTSIEWIAGVAVYLVLFVIGMLESTSRPNPHFAWLVKRDILGPLLTVVSKAISLQPACYRCDELTPDPLKQGLHPHPPITGYRILVSTITVLFAMAKASMSYLGLSGSANAMDWTFGVVVTTILYCVGLYEDNPVGILPSLFETNYQPVLSPIFFAGGSFTMWMALYLGGISAAVVWCTLWGRVLQTSWIDPIPPHTVGDGTKVTDPPGFPGYTRGVSMDIMTSEVICLFIAMGVAVFFALLGMLISMLGRVGIVRRSFRIIRQALIHMLLPFSKWLPTSDHEIPFPITRLWYRILNFGRFIKRFGIHILALSLSGSFCILFAFFWLTYPFMIWHSHETFAQLIASVALGIMSVTVSAPFGAAGCAGAFLSFRALVMPFLQDWNAPGYVAGVLENPFANLKVF